MNKMTKEVNVLRNRLAAMSIEDVKSFIVKINDEAMKVRLWAAYRSIMIKRSIDSQVVQIYFSEMDVRLYRAFNSLIA